MMIPMFFRRKKREKVSEEWFDTHNFAMKTLDKLCKDGMVIDDVFVLKDKDIYVYADVNTLDENVVQIIFQIHHEWMEDAMVESVAASGNSLQEAITLACEDFYKHTLSLYIHALNQAEEDDTVVGFTQFRHYFKVYKNEIHGIGKREGIMEHDFWDMLKEEIARRLGNKRVYWVKVFASKNGPEVLCEVRINGIEDSKLSESLLSYAENWDCIGRYHTEKQNFLLIQDEKSYEPSIYTKEQICQYTKKAIKWYEKCAETQNRQKLKDQLIRLCKDDSLAYELYSFIPELYCKYAYPEVEYGNHLFLIQKDQEMMEYYQSQLQSFAYVEEVVMEHLKKDNVASSIIENMIRFSANARAIQQALDEGDALDELMIPGIGYFVNKGYIMR